MSAAAAADSKPAAKKAASKKSSSSLTYEAMIKQAIAAHPADARAGISRSTIKKYLQSHFPETTNGSEAAFNTRVNQTITRGAEKKVFVLPKGPSGKVKLAPKEKTPAEKKPKEKKPASEKKPKEKKEAATKKPAAKKTVAKKTVTGAAAPKKAASSSATKAKKPAAKAPAATAKKVSPVISTRDPPT
ncbi:hypothetical protein ACQY0O_007415 [Thecaphora frezii]